MCKKVQKLPTLGCWYCEGGVSFDSDLVGYCDSCGETYSYDEFVDRGIAPDIEMLT